ncbi:hypothetical protein Tco_1490507 [Tanacetum coccineum]
MSSLSSTSYRRYNRNQDVTRRTHCDCDPPHPIPIQIAWTIDNPGRRFRECLIRDKSKKCGVYGFLDLELPGDYYKSLVYNLHEENKALKKMNKVPGVVMEDSNIIVLSSDSEDVNDGPSKGKVPKDVNDDVSSSYSFPFSTDEETSEDETTNNKMTNKTTGKNLMFYEDTKYIPVGKSASQKSILKSNKPSHRSCAWPSKFEDMGCYCPKNWKEAWELCTHWEFSRQRKGESPSLKLMLLF